MSASRSPARRQSGSSTPPAKERTPAYLITSPGFTKQFSSSLAAILVVLMLAQRNDWVQGQVDHIMGWWSCCGSRDMMMWSHKLELWALTGLLASACCALQLVLNVFSLGCAGFNTVLGPVRPTLLAGTVVLQVWAWSVAYSRPYQWKPTAMGSAMAVSLSFLPELLDVCTRRKAALAEQRVQTSASGPQRFVAVIALEGMGCTACVTKITGTLEACVEDVAACSVSLDEGCARVWMHAHVGEEAARRLVQRVLVPKIAAAGFNGSLRSVGPQEKASASLGSTGLLATSPQGKRLLAQPTPATTWLTALALGLASSSCCLLQLGLNALAVMDVVHIGCAGFNKVLGPWRVYTRLATGAWLTMLWTAAVLRKWPKKQLVLSTGLALVLAFLPELLKLSGGPALAPPTASVQEYTLHVEGMGCEACEMHVRGVIERASGVVGSAVDLATGVAQVQVAREWGFNTTAIGLALAKDGFTLLSALPTPAAGVVDSTATVGLKAEL